MTIEVEKELECDGAAAYVNANFIATRLINSPNIAGYGFHNRNVNAGILYLSNDGILHFLNKYQSNGAASAEWHNVQIVYTIN